ncbi:hypothetical protein TW95_gp0436 [Pandoravirus inopinatum]|uniref:Uncharacterized protein n=1 Tax=Pandoravirus inopinatum TaxID=1605721 RepID=A0A0B5J647_9VIRU|nr:hypothetical protein TW95_gp0436 [Pandoravirus inopinatum]AJF97170.1 hypothetical protein [Pandoravirus inopinatum]
MVVPDSFQLGRQLSNEEFTSPPRSLVREDPPILSFLCQAFDYGIYPGLEVGVLSILALEGLHIALPVVVGNVIPVDDFNTRLHPPPHPKYIKQYISDMYM